MADDLDFFKDVGLVRTTYLVPHGDNAVRLCANEVKARHLLELAFAHDTPEGTLFKMGDKRLHRMPPEIGELTLTYERAKKLRVSGAKKLFAELRDHRDEMFVARARAIDPDVTREESIRHAAIAYALLLLVLALYDQLLHKIEKGRER